jgi:hypothetical protein
MLPRDVFDRLCTAKSNQGQDSNAANDRVEDDDGGNAQWEDDDGAHSRNNSNKPGAATFAARARQTDGESSEEEFSWGPGPKSTPEGDIVAADEEVTKTQDCGSVLRRRFKKQQTEADDNNRHSDNEDEKGEDGLTTLELPAPGVTVYLWQDERAATAHELFDVLKRNIRIDGTLYTCSHSSYVCGSRERVIEKVYCCAMVRGQEGWFSMPSYRNSRAENSAGKEYTKKKIAGGKNKKAKATHEKCGGKIKGVFTKTGFYFVPHGTMGHACQLQHGGCRSDPDIRPPLLFITAAASWGLTNKMLANMKEALKSCPAVWWAPLPKQKTTRHWLQCIGEAVTPREKLVKRQVKLLLDPFLYRPNI